MRDMMCGVGRVTFDVRNCVNEDLVLIGRQDITLRGMEALKTCSRWSSTRPRPGPPPPPPPHNIVNATPCKPRAHARASASQNCRGFLDMYTIYMLWNLWHALRCVAKVSFMTALAYPLSHAVHVHLHTRRRRAHPRAKLRHPHHRGRQVPPPLPLLLLLPPPPPSLLTSAIREMVESECDVILDAAAAGNAAFLVVGDAFGATTHTDLYIRARERGIEVKVVSGGGGGSDSFFAARGVVFGVQSRVRLSTTSASSTRLDAAVCSSTNMVKPVRSSSGVTP
jgi:hypothetical protein